MRRKEITDTLSRELHKLPLDIEVWLYGSEARGDARPDSDIDLLVLFNTKSHDGVKQMFGLHFVRTGIVSEELGRFYSRLFDKRTQGDYEDLFDNTKEICDNSYPIAKQFVERVSQLANDWLKEQETNTHEE